MRIKRTETAAGEMMSLNIQETTSELSWWDHFLARMRVNRGGHRVELGLYALGHPAPESSVFVTANYTLSFDALLELLSHSESMGWRQAVKGSAFLLALPPVTAFLSLNLTGSTPFTSQSGVKREIFTYVPIMAWILGRGMCHCYDVGRFDRCCDSITEKQPAM